MTTPRQGLRATFAVRGRPRKLAVRFAAAGAICAGMLLHDPQAVQAQWQEGRGRYEEPSGRESHGRRRAVAGYGPTEPAQRLEEVLQRYREIERRGGWRTLPAGLAMGPPYSYECSRIVPLERRLIAEGYLDRESRPPPAPPAPQPVSKRQQRKAPPPPPVRTECRYGPALTEAVKAFQADRKVLGFGQVGAKTLTELNRPVREIITTLEHDVARWRKVSLPSSGTFLLVNIPFYELIAFENGREVLRMPVVVGLPSWRTPTFGAEIQYLVLNPDWGIPDKIAKLEYLPQARRDPNYLKRSGISADGGSLRQKPGPSNPLGRIKFIMPNPNDVYLHDTPHKGAFKAAVKALSHGCIRLSAPVDLAHHLLEDDPQWDPRRLEREMASGKTKQVNLLRKMPVQIVYSTTRVNDEGRLELRPDVYGLSKGRPPEVEEGEYRDPRYDQGP